MTPIFLDAVDGTIPGQPASGVKEIWYNLTKGGGMDDTTNAVKEENVFENVVLDPYTSPSLFIEAKEGLNVNVDHISEIVRIHVIKEDKLYVLITMSNGKSLTLEDEEAGVFMALVAQYRPMLVRKGMLELPSEDDLVQKGESGILTP